MLPLQYSTRHAEPLQYLARQAVGQPPADIDLRQLLQLPCLQATTGWRVDGPSSAVNNGTHNGTASHAATWAPAQAAVPNPSPACPNHSTHLRLWPLHLLMPLLLNVSVLSVALQRNATAAAAALSQHNFASVGQKEPRNRKRTNSPGCNPCPTQLYYQDQQPMQPRSLCTQMCSGHSLSRSRAGPQTTSLALAQPLPPTCEETEMYSPTAMDSAPATRADTPESTSVCLSVVPPPTPAVLQRAQRGIVP